MKEKGKGKKKKFNNAEAMREEGKACQNHICHARTG